LQANRNPSCAWLISRHQWQHFPFEQPHTRWELLQFVGTLIQESPVDGPTEDYASLLRSWLLGGLQVEVGKTMQAWVLNITPVVSTDPAFTEWCYHHISSIMGDQAEVPMGPTGREHTAQGMSALELSLSRMADVVERLAMDMSTLTQMAQAKVAVSSLYMEHQVAMIKRLLWTVVNGVHHGDLGPVSNIQTHQRPLVELRQADERMVLPARDSNLLWRLFLQGHDR
jgi:hypothetical protein